MLETPVIPDVIEKPPIQPTVKTFTQAEVDSAAAGARKEAEAKFKVADERLAVLEAQEKEREEAEMSETEKLKSQLLDKDKEIESHKINSNWRTQWETKEAESIEKEMEDLTDNQKIIVNGLPLESRRLAVAEFKASSIEPSPSARKGGNIDGVPTLEECRALRVKFGAGSSEYREAYRKYSATR